MVKKINLLIVTFFYTGHIKVASGTFASLFTSIILFIIFRLSISFAIFLTIFLSIFVIFFYSLIAIKYLKNEFKEVDASEIVIDEVVGQMIPIIMIEFINFLKFNTFGADLTLYVVSFFLFRFFDIFKPFFIRYFDENFKNSFGVMFDDVLAGIYTSLTIYFLLTIYKLV